MPAFQRNKHPNHMKQFFLPSTTSLQKVHHDLYLRRNHSSSAAIPVFPQRKLAFIRPILQKTLAKWTLQRWTSSKKRRSSDAEKCRVDRRCFVQMPSVGGVQLRRESNEGLCRKLVKNRRNTAGCNTNHGMAVSQANIVRAGEKYCGKDVTTCGASCSAISAKHLTVGTVACSAPLFTLPVSEGTDTGNCLNTGNPSVSSCDEGGTTCALKICKHREEGQLLCADGAETPERRNFADCVKLCTSACEDGHLKKDTRVLDSQPSQALKITSWQTEGTKTGSHPQTFCDAFSQFLMCSSRTMDAVKRKVEKVPDQKAKYMAKVQDCNNDKFFDLRANISTKAQPDFNTEMLPELRTEVSIKVSPVLRTQISAENQLESSDEVFPDLKEQPCNKVPLSYDDEKLPGVGSESPGKVQRDWNRKKQTSERDSEPSKEPEMSNRSENDPAAITNISDVDNSIPDVIDVVTGDLNSTVHSGCRFAESFDMSFMTDENPNLLLHASFADSITHDVTTRALSNDGRIDGRLRVTPNDLKDNRAQEASASFSTKHPTMLRSFSYAGLNTEFELQNNVGSKVTVSENLDSGISDSDQASSRHTIDSSQGSLGVTDTEDIAMETIEDVAVETVEDVATEMSNRDQSGSSGMGPVCSGIFHHNRFNDKYSDATEKELTEELTVDESSDSDVSSRLRVLESHCRPVCVLLRRLTSEVIDALCNHPQTDSAKPCHPESSPQAKTPKKKDLLLSGKPRQSKSSKSETKKRKPKPPSWSKDDIAENITLDLVNWLPDLADGGTNVRRSSNAMKRKFDGSVSDESLDGSTPYIPNFMTHSTFDSMGCSIAEKWRKACELEEEWLKDSGISPAFLSCKPNTSCMSFPPTTGDCFSSLNGPGNFSNGLPHGCLQDKLRREVLTDPPKRKTKPKKKETTRLDEGQSRTSTKTKARRQSKKIEIDVSDEASSDVSILPSCQNSAKLMQRVTVVGGNSVKGNTNSGNSCNKNTNNGNTPTGNTTSASTVTRNLQLANVVHDNCSHSNSVTKEPVIKNCLNENFLTGSTPSGNMLTRNNPVGNAPIANTMSGNASTRNTTTANAATVRTFTGSIPTGNTSTENTSAESSVARNTINGNSPTKNSQTGNLIVRDPLAGKPQTGKILTGKPVTRNFQLINIQTGNSPMGNSFARGSSADKPRTVTNSTENSLPGKTEPEFSQITNTTVKCELISKSATDRVEFGQQKSQAKFSVLPQLKSTTTKQSPLTVSLRTTSVSESHSPPSKRSRDYGIRSENQNCAEKLQLSNTGILSTVASTLPAVASTCSSPSNVPGIPSTMACMKPVTASTSCCASRAADIPGTVTSIVPVVTSTSSSPTGVASIASSASTVSSPFTSVPTCTVQVAQTDSRSSLNSSIVSSVVTTKHVASASTVLSYKTQSTELELAGESGPSKKAIVEVTFNTLSNDLKSGSMEGTKSQHGSTERKPQKPKQVAKPRVKPTSDARTSPPKCYPDGTISSVPKLDQTFVAGEFVAKAPAREPAQIGGELSEPRCNREMSSWLAASMGLYTCLCGAAFSDSWSCHQHQMNCVSGPPE